VVKNEMMDSEQRSTEKYEGPLGPVIASILGIIAWLIFIIIYALYWSNGFTIFQNIIVTIVSIMVAGLLIGAMWLIWFHPTGERRRKVPSETKI